MLDIEILAIGKIKIGYINNGVMEYVKRLSPYAKIKIVELPAIAFNSNNKAKVKVDEGKKIQEYLAKRPGSWVVFLEEKGKSLNSVNFASIISKINKKIIIVIGGSLGIDPEINFKPDFNMSLSALTFNHELARLVLFEQLYRAVTIINKKEYHY